MILKGTIISSISPSQLKIIENGGLVLDDEGTILEILDKVDENANDVIDYSDKLIMQSFCDMHLHAPQYPMVGMGMDLPLLEWLNTYTFKTESYFKDLEYARKVYKQLAKDLINHGTTRVAMFSSLHEEATIILMEELEKAGVTGYVGKVNMDRNSIKELEETTKESEEATLKFLKDTQKFRNLKPILTPRFTPSCTDELMEWLGNLAKKENLYVQSHLSENTSEGEWVHSLHPDCDHYYKSYLKYGLWKEKTLMAHCVYSDEEERKAIKDHNVVVVHCADSNTNLTSGVCPLRVYLNEGCWVVLGSDIAGGALLPMYKNIQETIKISKIYSVFHGKEYQPLSVNEAFYLATSSAQKYFDVGEGFKAGQKLHAIIVDDSNIVQSVRPLTPQERFERAIYLMEEKNIIAVYSEGKKVK